MSTTNMDLQVNEEDPLFNFMYGLKAKDTKRQYPKRLKVFMDHCCQGASLELQAKKLIQRAKENPVWIQNALINFIEFQKERVLRGEIVESTIGNYYKATKLFFEMNDIVLNWKKITRGLPRGRQAANDRAPTIDEIQKLVEYPDRRIKPIVYTMMSSGIRLGSFDYLKWKHIVPIKDNIGEVIAAKIIVYAGENDEYFSFITPEAYSSLKDWMDFRNSYGENITGESWLMRDLWQTTNVDYRYRNGLAAYPKKLKSSGIKRLLERALWEQGLRIPLKQGQKRHEWKAAHGFRKFYKTRAEQVMKPLHVEMTMGHDIGLSASYYEPTEKEVFDDYIKGINLLTISYNRKRIEQQLEKIKEENRQDNYATRGQLDEKENEISILKNQHRINTEAIANLSDKVMELAEEVARARDEKNKI